MLNTFQELSQILLFLHSNIVMSYTKTILACCSWSKTLCVCVCVCVEERVSSSYFRTMKVFENVNCYDKAALQIKQTKTTGGFLYMINLNDTTSIKRNHSITFLKQTSMKEHKSQRSQLKLLQNDDTSASHLTIWLLPSVWKKSA